MGPDPAVAACRSAVRPHLPGAGAAVLVACSGGADSLALLAAAVAEGRQGGVRVVGVTVDHGLQEGSAEHAGRVVAQMAALGAEETVTVRVRVDERGEGPEAAAREARYAVLREVAQRYPARESAGQRVGSRQARPAGVAPVLLGHTLDDQAETVLLGLARGSGTRSLSGMRRGFDGFSRPLLDCTRAQTEAACRAQGIDWWTDPHNADPRFTRSRVRHDVLPVLERELGPGVAQALARTAAQCRRDADALDDLAEQALAEAREEDRLRVDAVARQPEAVLFRVLRLAALEAGAPAVDLTHERLTAVAGLVLGTAQRTGGKQVQLPGHVTVERRGNRLRFGPTAVRG